MALTQVSRGLLSTSIVDNGNATAITIDSSENVGIGTTTVGQFDSTDVGLTVDSGNAYSGIAMTDGATTSTLAQGFSTTYLYNQANGNMLFGTNNTERMRIDASGNLLVGKTAPTISTTGVELRPNGQVFATQSGNYSLLLNRTTSDGDIVQFRKDGTAVGNIGVESGDNFVIEATATDHAGLLLWGSGGFGRVTPRLNGSEANGTVDLGRSAGRFKDLYLSGDIAHKDAADNARLLYDKSSNLLGNVGTNGTFATAKVGATAGSFGAKLTVESPSSYTFESRRTGTGSQGHVVFRNANGAVGSIFTNGSTTSYNTSSDERLKENIVDADDAGSKVDAIQVRQFDWIADGSHQDYGMVAQELQTVAPEAVSAPEDPEEMMGVDYSKLVPMLVKEIQSLRSRVQQLENN